MDIQQVIHTYPGFAAFQLAKTSHRTAVAASARGAVLDKRIQAAIAAALLPPRESHASTDVHD